MPWLACLLTLTFSRVYSESGVAVQPEFYDPRLRNCVEEQVLANSEPRRASDGREQLIRDLNEDLAREYQATIAYVIYPQVLKGAEYMEIATELEKHAAEELKHALIISKQID